MTAAPRLPAAPAPADVDTLFNPRGIAVIGASSVPGKLGNVMARSLSSYEKPVALINPRGEGMYANVQEASDAVDGSLDLAVLCVPAGATAHALRSAAEAGLGAALVCAGGFAEAGEAGRVHQEEVLDVVDETGIRLLGPNTSGFFIPGRSLTASFVPGVTDLSAGTVGVISSSGGVNHSLSFRLEQAGAGVSLGVGLGAGLDVTAADVIDYLAEDPQTKAIALHIETVSDGPRLMEAVRHASALKPVVALVVGKNDVAEFAQSHTGALATSWRSTSSALSQNGAVTVADETELVDVVSALAETRMPAHPDPGIALITGQAGPGLIIADHLAGAGIKVPRFAERTAEQLSKLLPPLTFQGNPVDTGRPGENFSSVIGTVADDPAVHAVGLYGIIEPVADFPAAISSAEIGQTAAVLSIDGPHPQVREVVRSGAQHGIPVLNGPTALARGLVGLVKDARAQWAIGRPELHAEPIALGAGPWDEAEAKDLLERAGVRVPKRGRARSHAEAHTAFAALKGPAAIKLVDATVLHKTEIGGVQLGITTGHELDAALGALDSAGAEEYLIEEMAPAGVDLVVGARHDPVFGTILLLGIGGTAVEATGDVAVRPLPLRDGATTTMIDELTARELLQGWRGGPTIDVDALAYVLSVLGETLESSPGITEIEINPLRLTHDGLIALDAVIAAESTTVKED